MDIIRRTGVALERLCGSEGRNGRRYAVMPSAGIGVHLFVREPVVIMDLQALIGPKERDPINAPA